MKVESYVHIVIILTFLTFCLLKVRFKLRNCFFYLFLLGICRDQQKNRELDIITGFQVLDGQMHLFVLEGLRSGGVQYLWKSLPKPENSGNCDFYRPHPKDGEGNVFTLSTPGGGGGVRSVQLGGWGVRSVQPGGGSGQSSRGGQSSWGGGSVQPVGGGGVVSTLRPLAGGMPLAFMQEDFLVKNDCSVYPVCLCLCLSFQPLFCTKDTEVNSQCPFPKHREFTSAQCPARTLCGGKFTVSRLGVLRTLNLPTHSVPELKHRRETQTQTETNLTHIVVAACIVLAREKYATLQPFWVY